MANELTLDQLQSVSGANRMLYNETMRNSKGAYALKRLAKSGQLVPKMKTIPDPMVRFVPGDTD